MGEERGPGDRVGVGDVVEGVGGFLVLGGGVGWGGGGWCVFGWGIDELRGVGLGGGGGEEDVGDC